MSHIHYAYLHMAPARTVLGPHCRRQHSRSARLCNPQGDKRKTPWAIAQEHYVAIIRGLARDDESMEAETSP